MVKQTLDSKVSEYGLCNPENSSLNCAKQSPVAVKKTPMEDLQNENRKDTGAANTVSGTKRPPAWLIPSKNQFAGSNSPNPHLVYVRRKSEADCGKNSIHGGVNMSMSTSPCPRKVANLEETKYSKNQIEEPKVSSFSNTPLKSSCVKASVPLSVGESVASATPLKKIHLDERYFQLQMQLNRLDQSSRDDYVQMLRSLSSVELSRLAFELEKKSIQLLLEEANEMRRLAQLNVLGKSLKNV